MKVFKIFALLMGLISIFTGFAGCDKEECCSWTDSYGDSYKYCESDPGWQQYYNSWAAVVGYIESYYPGACD